MYKIMKIEGPFVPYPHLPMVHVVVLVCLHMVFITRMCGSRSKNKVDSVPQESEGRSETVQCGGNGSEVVQVLDWMHAETREGFNIRVSVVHTVNVLVQAFDVHQSMGEVEVQVAKERNKEEPRYKL